MTAPHRAARARPVGGLAVTAFLAGLVSAILIALVFFTFGGAWPLVLSALVGAVGLAAGVLAFRRGQSRVLAIIGIVAGSLSLLFSLGVLAFAFVFVGAMQ
ncbi:hypothetical protein [Leucobacter luti]|uniref:DUF4190 domain-containing protein n=1 Tax=Leucobacter luti TaxID=340320 RepID=A0A4Q7U4I0_9MICO|nr:hypothetical protein [Leucobacter luti]RZT68575.1 hypothetical protein EV139_0301 [Leucobacter luti]